MAGYSVPRPRFEVRDPHDPSRVPSTWASEADWIRWERAEIAQAARGRLFAAWRERHSHKGPFEQWLRTSVCGYAAGV